MSRRNSVQIVRNRRKATHLMHAFRILPFFRHLLVSGVMPGNRPPAARRRRRPSGQERCRGFGLSRRRRCVERQRIAAFRLALGRDLQWRGIEAVALPSSRRCSGTARFSVRARFPRAFAGANRPRSSPRRRRFRSTPPARSSCRACRQKLGRKRRHQRVVGQRASMK